MKLYSYVITRDFGFAPNPFGGICSLATCKPQIRERAMVGDWITGFGGKRTRSARKLVYLMRVDNTCDYDTYWSLPEYFKKRPGFYGKYEDCYGDNIYHHDECGNWIQEDSHHSYENGMNEINLNHDTNTNRVLISRAFWYFGDEAVLVPESLDMFIAKSRGYCVFNEEKCQRLVNWVEKTYSVGRHGLPFSWTSEGQFVRYRGERK